jgi:hypothetical protein
MLSALLTRGVGFIASLSLAREAGAEALSLYMALVITGAAVVAPFGQVFLNSATMAAARVSGTAWLGQFVRVNLAFALMLALPLMGVFAFLHWKVASASAAQLGVLPIWLAWVGASVVVAPLWQAVLTGVLNGSGWQTRCAKMTALCAAVVMPLSYPAAHWAGVRGAWMALMLSVWLPFVVLAWVWFKNVASMGDAAVNVDDDQQVEPWRQSWRYFKAGLPNAGALLLGGLVTWWCTVHLPQKVWGAQGVAILSINSQWLSLMLLPATSWGGVALSEMAQAHASRVGRPQAWGLIRRWLARNGVVTLVVVLVVMVAASRLEAAYRMEGQGLRALLLISGLSAMLSALYAVFERALICWGHQHYLLLTPLLAAVVQVLATQLLIDQSLLGVQQGMLLGAGVMLVFGCLVWRAVLNNERE